MPVLPRSDILDFDGFVIRRGIGAGCMNARPPEMRQASLIKNPVSIRRDSARILGGDKAASPNQKRGKAPASVAADQGDGSVLSFIFDAQRGGQLSVHLLVRESEKPVQRADAGLELQGEGDTLAVKGNGPQSVPRTIELLPQELEESDSNMPVAVELESRVFAPGLGQCYESPAVNFSRWSSDRLGFDPKRPRDVPIAVRLEAEPAQGEPPTIHYTYISLQLSGRTQVAESQADDASGDADAPTISPRQHKAVSAMTFAQKLQYGGECFVLHEVFGVSSKASDAEPEGGNSDCVICLSEPRDTAVLPCRHMCFCSYCAGIVRLQCDRCPVCRQKVASLLQFKRNPDNSLSELRGDKGASTGSASTSGQVAGGLPITSAPAAIGSAVAASAAAAAGRRPSQDAVAPRAQGSTSRSSPIMSPRYQEGRASSSGMAAID
jgi:hypothetical protein